MITLTPEQHRVLDTSTFREIFTEALRHTLECRELETARMDGPVPRLKLARIRENVRLDAPRIVQQVMQDMNAADCQPSPRLLSDRVALVASDAHDEKVLTWLRS